MRFFLVIIIYCFTLNVSGQHFLKIIPLDKDTVFLKKIFPFESKYSNEFERDKQLHDNLFKLYSNGYLTASFDSLVSDSNSMTAYLSAGKIYKWLYLKNGNIDEGALSSAGFREKLYTNKPFSFKNLMKLQERIITFLENNGYPFALVKLDSIKIEGEQIAAKLYVVKNRQIIIDSINVQGNIKITRKYLQNYLGVNPKEWYNESEVKNISKRIKEIPFLQEEKPMNVEFFDDKARINLFLKNKKASRFNFMIGFLPNNEQTNKLLITGEAMLLLHNSLGGGEVININWKKYQAYTQNLKVKFFYPYLPLLPFGVDFNFELYKKDTTYLDLIKDIGLQYSFTGNNYLKAFFHNKKSSLLTTDSIRIQSRKKLPDNIDISFNMYGLEYHVEKLDYRYNPKNGFDFKINAGAGIRKIFKNNKITSLKDEKGKSLEYLYDSLKLRTVQYQGNYYFNYYLPFSSRSVLKLGTIGGAIISDQIFNNELYRIGGNQQMRGFDEEALFTSLYNILTIEYRFLIGENSYLYLFNDLGYLENNALGFSQTYSAHPFADGFGAGITFETKVGIFALSYALGTQQGNEIQVKSAKIHFGYVNYF